MELLRMAVQHATDEATSKQVEEAQKHFFYFFIFYF
jgi:hypothetical protein